MSEKINVRFIIEIAGKPVETVQKALETVLEKLKSEKTKFSVLESDLAEAKFDDDVKLYTGFLDVLIKFKNSKSILDFILDYTPTSIEIESPEKIELNSQELTGILNDISTTLLSTQSTIRKLNAYVHMQNDKIKELEKK